MAEQLYRTSEVLLRADMAGRTIHGRIVPYGEVAEVSDGGPRYRERFDPGAFTRSITERAHKVRLHAMHETRRLAIGKATQLEERSDGVYGSFLVARTRDGDDALELVDSGVVGGFSIGFTPIKERRERDGTVVRLEAALREVSLVNEGAYVGAAIAGIRSATPRLSVQLARRRLALIDKDYPWQ
jgi:uncharacterized protein